MGFLWKRKAPPRKDVDPLEAFDQMIASLERQGAEVRKSAATLLALRGELVRERDKLQKRLAGLDDRRAKADGDEVVERTLLRDETEAKRALAKAEESCVQAERDGKLLMETAEALTSQLADLKEERIAARTRLSAGLMVSDALKARVANFDKVMKLDAARDEVERAHALAELYREESEKP
ncbi:MAG: hypothetical protein QM817_16715 [Archangium sp.]